jgi:hypothetical protein
MQPYGQGQRVEPAPSSQHSWVRDSVSYPMTRRAYLPEPAHDDRGHRHAVRALAHPRRIVRRPDGRFTLTDPGSTNGTSSTARSARSVR